MEEKLTLVVNERAIEITHPVTAQVLLAQASPPWRKEAVAVRVNGKIFDLMTPIHEEGVLEPVTPKDPELLEILRHSTAHLMAHALKRKFGHVKLGVGPPVEDGFYYDVDIPGTTILPEILPEIERIMGDIIQANYPVVRIMLKKDEAIRFFQGKVTVEEIRAWFALAAQPGSTVNAGEGSEQGAKPQWEAIWEWAENGFYQDPYKVEIIREIPDPMVSLYAQNEFVDLCAGPHLPSTGKIAAFKLTSIAGAYWRGKETNPMLQRIYGTAFPDEKQLEAYLTNLAEAAKRDHRKLGKELDLFSIAEEVGAGLILWHPKGAMIRILMEEFLRKELLKRGYQFVSTPHVGRSLLWKTSGHLDYFLENMFPSMEMENQTFYCKPMNCPFHIMIYKSDLRSYRDLPFRLAEFGTVYRYERSGVLHGTLRVRGFTQDDAHVFLRRSQVEEEVERLIDLTLFILQAFGFEQYEVLIATRPEKAVGSVEDWDHATEALKTVTTRKGLHYRVDEGGGAFYGPKIDVSVKDALNRSWQCTTIQFDFNLPERFNLCYMNEENQKERPIMVHRAIFGSFERFFGVLIEHYAGAFPLWLAPVQVRLLPIATRHLPYAQELRSFLEDHGARVEIDSSNEKTGYKIRKAQMEKIPYMLVMGDREMESKTVAVRERKAGDLGPMPWESFLQRFQLEVLQRASASASDTGSSSGA